MCLIVCVICTGLASRRYRWLFPAILHDYPGDALWAMASYLVLVLAFPAISPRQAAAGALAISFGVEVSQLYHDERIDGIRRTLFGRLILGSGFDWLDLVAYGVGVGIVSMLDTWVVNPLSDHRERIEK